MASARQLGERKIIELFFDCLDRMPRMPLPLGDDVSAFEIGGRKLGVLKCDMLVGRTDAPRGMSYWQMGRKAVVMSVSDLAAKGVKPLAIMASLGFPPNVQKKDLQGLAMGLNAGAREYGAYVVGGDMNEASDVIIDCVAFGLAEKNRLVTRSGARPGDILAVTGPFGNVSAGLRMILQKKKAPEEIGWILARHVYLPEARLREGLRLAPSLTAAIDSSDGLAWSLYELSRMSKVGFDLTRIPVAKEAREFAALHHFNPENLALYGGEEYELVVTIKPSKFAAARKAVGGRLLDIGRVTRRRGSILYHDGQRSRRIEPKGWEHFKN